MTVPDSVFNCCCDWGFEWIPRGTETADVFYYVGTGCRSYNIDDDAWSAKTGGSSSSGIASATVLGEAYAWGGVTTTQKNESYSKSGDSWTTHTNMTTGRFTRPAGMSLNSLGYVAGGDVSIGNATTINEEHDPVGDSWASRTSTPSPARSSLATAEISGNESHIMGGSNHVADNDQYSQSGDSWTSKTDLLSPGRSAAAACFLDSNVYLTTGGYVPTPPFTTLLRDTDEYDPVGDSWASKTDCPIPARSGGSFTAASEKGYLHHSNSAQQDTDEYDPSGDSWTSKTNDSVGSSVGGDAAL